LEKISSNLYNPFKIKTYDNKAYFITFLNKNSQYLKVRLLANKTKVYSIFLEFKTTAKNNLKGYKIKVFQYNNGTKYKTLHKYLRKKGIIIQLNPPYTPKSNRLPERINRTIMTKVQAILIKSNAPKYLWGKAILATIYIYNKTPHNTLNFKTPYKIKHNKKPNINNIKI